MDPAARQRDLPCPGFLTRIDGRIQRDGVGFLLLMWIGHHVSYGDDLYIYIYTLTPKKTVLDIDSIEITNQRLWLVIEWWFHMV